MLRLSVLVSMDECLHRIVVLLLPSPAGQVKSVRYAAISLGSIDGFHRRRSCCGAVENRQNSD